MRRSTDSVIQNPRLLMIIAIGVVIATEGSVNGQLRSAFGPAEADAKRLSGPPAKIGQHLRQVQGQVRAILEETGPGPEIIALSVPRAWRSRADGAIQTYIWLAAVTDNELGALQAEGIVVEAFERRYMKVVQSWLTPTKIERVAEFAFVRRITLPDYAVVRTGSVTSEGDSIHKADLVRGAPQGVDGSGVLVGVISDGVDSRNTAAATGDLPETFPGSGVANIQIDPARPGAGDEGTAMLEIVHDLAPGTTLAFSGPSTSVDMVNSIGWLAATANADIIVDDLGFYGQPYFEDGAIADAAKDAVTVNGRVYVSSAGNAALDHHQGTYANVVVNNGATGGANWDLYDWDGAGDHSLDVTIPGKQGATDGKLWIYLQWDDQFGVSSNDYDLYLVDWAETAVLFSSTDPQTGTQDPIETLAITNGGAAVNARVYVRRFNTPTGPRTLELFMFGNNNTPDPMQEHVVAADSIVGHPAVTEVISCAAVDQAEGAPWCTIESFSSRGPSTIAHPAAQIRDTPYCTGIDGVSITGAGGFPNPFFGTSASAPHVAAVAALVKSCDPLATPAQVQASIIVGATDCDGVGFDRTFGHGLVMANTAVSDLCAPMGACCFPAQPNHPCLHMTELSCAAEGGYYHGDGTTCGPQGACCYDGGASCEVLPQICCDEIQGSWTPGLAGCLGDGNGNGIDDVCETADGACCHGDGSCTNVTLAECQQDGGDFAGVGTGCAGDTDYDGVDDICTITRPVPAFTDWGLAGLTLLLVIAGVTVMRRSKARAA